MTPWEAVLNRHERAALAVVAVMAVLPPLGRAVLALVLVVGGYLMYRASREGDGE